MRADQNVVILTYHCVALWWSQRVCVCVCVCERVLAALVSIYVPTTPNQVEALLIPSVGRDKWVTLYGQFETSVCVFVCVCVCMCLYVCVVIEIYDSINCCCFFVFFFVFFQILAWPANVKLQHCLIGTWCNLWGVIIKHCIFRFLKLYTETIKNGWNATVGLGIMFWVHLAMELVVIILAM